jgi:hypothetical protein
MILYVTLRKNNTQHHPLLSIEWHYAECRFAEFTNFAVMLSVIMLGVVMMSVVAPSQGLIVGGKEAMEIVRYYAEYIFCYRNFV